MRVILITQDEPFYLKDCLPKLFDELSCDVEVIGAIVLSPSPFGKRESLFQKAIRTLRIFGLKFFLYYSCKLIFNKIRYQSLENLLARYKVPTIKLSQSINRDASLELIRNRKPDLLVSIMGNEIFRQPLLDIAPCLNLHTADLPRYRGLMPTFWALKNNETEIGVSVFWVDQGIDSGQICQKQLVKIDNFITQKDLIVMTKRLGMTLMARAINEYSKGVKTMLENDDRQATYYGFPTRDDVRTFISSGKKFF